MPRPRALTAALIASLAYVSACSSDPPPPPRTAQANLFASDAVPRPRMPPPPPAVGARADMATLTSGSIHIDERILRACGDLPTAHFAFDSAAVQADAAAALDALARCFMTGPLAGRAMLLVGHTDPRGEVEYNLALGHRRAGNVGRFLEGRGMQRAQITTTSHGELDASGTDEAGWARDRKVDVALVQ
jgi:peptidoglycan-associated lipoprotein